MLLDDGGSLTFETRGDANDWLSLRRSEILRNDWLPPAAPKVSPVAFRKYAEAWLGQRDLEDRTREHYAQLLRDHVFPVFGTTPVPSITPATVRTWHANLAKLTGPTARAHAYALLRSIMNTAVADDLVAANPCRVRGAGQTRRAKKIVPATLAELETLTTSMPGKYQLLVLLAAWCGLRFGELAELRRCESTSPTARFTFVVAWSAPTSAGRSRARRAKQASGPWRSRRTCCPS